jgi:hypothetical protein
MQSLNLGGEYLEGSNVLRVDVQPQIGDRDALRVIVPLDQTPRGNAEVFAIIERERVQPSGAVDSMYTCLTHTNDGPVVSAWARSTDPNELTDQGLLEASFRFARQHGFHLMDAWYLDALAERIEGAFIRP